MAMTFFARCASSCENVPSPAPRSAITMGGMSFNRASASAFQDRPGTYCLPNRPASSSKYVRIRSWRLRSTSSSASPSALDFGNLGGGLAQSFDQRAPAERLHAVEDVLAGAAVLDQPRLLQLRQVRGDRALPGGEDLLQLGHVEFLAFEQQQDAEPVRIGQQPQRFQD